jgi:hypothetical protein
MDAWKKKRRKKKGSGGNRVGAGEEGKRAGSAAL